MIKRVFDAAKAVAREYGYKPKRKQSISKTFAKAARIQKPAPKLETLMNIREFEKELEKFGK